MKTKHLIAAVIFIISFSFYSCEDEISPPEIIVHELGYENSGIAYTGDDLHMEIEILAEGKIESIGVEIHSKEEDHDHVKKVSDGVSGEWEVEITYTEKYQGLKNTEFHEHLEIPADAETGHYHFHFYVNDMEGNQSVFEEEIELKAEEIQSE